MSALVSYAGVLLGIIGMMLIIAGVLASGLFLPGVIVLVVAMVVFAAAALLQLFRPAVRP